MSWTSSIVGPEVDGRDFWVAADLVLAALGEDAPLDEHGHAVDQVEGHVHVVLDQQDRRIAGEAADHCRDRRRLRGREPRGRLVEQQHLRRAGEGPDELDLTLLAVREPPGDLTGAVGEAPVGEQRLGALAQVTVRRARSVEREARGVEPLLGVQYAVDHGYAP